MRVTARPHRDDEGFALATCLMIVMAIFLLLAAILQPLSRDITTTRRFLSSANDRQLAESVLNELYTITSKSSSIPVFSLPGRVDPSTSTATKDVRDAGTFFGWGQFNALTGKYETCGTKPNSAGTGVDLPTNSNTALLVGTSCYYYSVLNNGSIVTVEVTTRSGCNSAGRNCVFKRYQQRWKRRSFLDYVMFTDQETLSPSLYPELPADGWTVTRANGTAGNVSHKVYRQWAIDHCADMKQQTTDFTATSGTVTNPMFEANYIPLSGTTTPVAPAADADSHRRQRPITDSAGLWSSFTGTSGAFVAGRQPAQYRHEDCFDIAYTQGAGAGDIIDGPIKTNDTYLWFCGQPIFKQPVAANGVALTGTAATDRDNYFRKSLQTGCSSDPTTDRPQSATAGVAPAVQQQPYFAIPKDLGDYWRFAALKLEAPAGGHATIQLTDAFNRASVTDAALTASPVTLQPRSLVFVKGDLWLSSDSVAKTSGVTFMSTGTITITGNLYGPGTTPTDIATKSSDIGVIAQGAVKINKSVTADLRIDASLMSIDEAVYVTDWNRCATAGTCGTKRTLNLNGSVIGRYRPVFGTYSGTGQLRDGMLKNIVYPTVQKPNPPYFLTPVNATWERIDLTEIQFQKLKNPAPGLVGLTAAPPLTGLATSKVKTTCAAGGADGVNTFALIPKRQVLTAATASVAATPVDSDIPACLAS
jgi:type II secretory pathway pseudopilin PulG